MDLVSPVSGSQLQTETSFFQEFSLPNLYFLTGWSASTSCLATASQHFIKHNACDRIKDYCPTTKWNL